jgi:ABC-2 type transport system permease protein
LERLKKKVSNRIDIVYFVRGASRIAYLHGILFLRRNPVSPLLNAATPFSLLFVLFVITGGGYVDFAIVGSMVMALTTVGLSVGQDVVVYRIEHKLQDIIVSSPVSSLTYMSGLALSQLLFGMPSLAILAILVVNLGGVPLIYIPVLIATMLLMWGTMSALGFLISSRISHQRVTNQVITTVSIGLGVIPPVYYSLDLLPQQLHYLAYLAPTTHASLILQQITALPTPQEWSLGLGFAALGVSLVVFLLLAIAKTAWSDE